MAHGDLPLSNMTHVGVSDAAGERTVTGQAFRDRFGVDALIRLHEGDCAQLARIDRESATNCKRFPKTV